MVSNECLNPAIIIGRGSDLNLPNSGEVTLHDRQLVLTGFFDRNVKWTNLTGLPADLLSVLVPGYQPGRDYTAEQIAALSVDGQPMAGFFQGYYFNRGHRMPTWSIAPLNKDKKVLLKTRRGLTILAAKGPYPGYDFIIKRASLVVLTLQSDELIVSWS